VAMSGIFHLTLRFKHVSSIRAWYDLVHLEHRIRDLVEVTASANVNLGISSAYLDCLEIVREVILTVNLVQGYCLTFGIVNVEFLWIFLHYVDKELCNRSHLLNLFLCPRAYWSFLLFKAFQNLSFLIRI
jgi:hypothetical protein